MLYTDGITEARAANGEQFGMDRMIEVIEREADVSSSAICDELFRQVEALRGIGRRRPDGHRGALPRPGGRPQLSPTGAWGFYAAPNATAIKTGQATLAAGNWHNVKLAFRGTTIRGAVDGTQVFSVTDKTWSTGSIGLGTATGTTAYFDNLIVNTVGGATPAPTVFPQDGENAVDAGAPPPDAGGGAGCATQCAWTRTALAGGTSTSTTFPLVVGA